MLTALCCYPRSNNLVVADSKGFLRVFQLANQNAHLISTHRLQRSSEIRQERAMNIGHNPDSLSPIGSDDDLIKEIYVTSNENTAVITFSSGLISLYDIKNSFSWLGDANETEFEKFNTQNKANDDPSIQTKVIEVSAQTGQNNTRSNFFRAQDEHPMASTTDRNASSFYGAYASNLKVLALTTPN
jgi:hypothetical protein